MATGAKVVFLSGTDKEMAFHGSVAGIDEDARLAVLQVDGEGLPVPLDVGQTGGKGQGTSAYVAGFPSAGRTTADRENPRVSIMPVDAKGKLDPGYSGGVVVNEAGGPAGIYMAGEGDASRGRVVSLETLHAVLKGRISTFTLTEVDNSRGKVRAEVSAKVIDPLGNLASAHILFAPEEMVRKKAAKGAEGRWSAFQPSLQFPLKLERRSANGEIAVCGNPGGHKTYLFQITYHPKGGVAAYTAPIEREMIFEKARPTSHKTNDKSWAREGRSELPEALASSDIVITAEMGGGGDVAGLPQTLGDVRYIPIEIASEFAGVYLYPNMQWSADGRFLYVTHQNGGLRELSVPRLQKTSELLIGRPSGRFAVARECPIALVKGEIWFLKTNPLAVTKKIKVDGAEDILASPGSNTIFACSQTGLKFYAVDAVGKRVVKEIDFAKLTARYKNRVKRVDESVWPLSRFSRPARMSRDGRFLVCVGPPLGNARYGLHRFQVNRFDLSYEEAGLFGNGRDTIELSPDSQYVAAGASTILDMKDFSKPVVSISTELPDRVLAFDPVAGYIYSNDRDFHLVVFDSKGARIKDYLSSKDIEDESKVRQILVHPEGHRAVLLTHRMIYWVELPR